MRSNVFIAVALLDVVAPNPMVRPSVRLRSFVSLKVAVLSMFRGMASSWHENVEAVRTSKKLIVLDSGFACVPAPLGLDKGLDSGLMAYECDVQSSDVAWGVWAGV